MGVLKKLKNSENSFVLTTEDDSLSEIHNGRQSHESFHSRLVNHCWSSSNGTSSCSSVWNRRTICHCTLFCCVEKDLKVFGDTLKKDSRLSEFLSDPSIQKSLKAQGLVAACDKLKMNELSKNLFLALAENNRFNLVEAVVKSFGTIMAGHRGEVVCEVTTSKAIDAAMKKEIDAAVTKFLEKGQKSLN